MQHFALSDGVDQVFLVDVVRVDLVLEVSQKQVDFGDGQFRHVDFHDGRSFLFVASLFAQFVIVHEFLTQIEAITTNFCADFVDDVFDGLLLDLHFRRGLGVALHLVLVQSRLCLLPGAEVQVELSVVQIGSIALKGEDRKSVV